MDFTAAFPQRGHIVPSERLVAFYTGLHIGNNKATTKEMVQKAQKKHEMFVSTPFCPPGIPFYFIAGDCIAATHVCMTN